MNTMTYKGYTARVEYDERDNLFIGRILGIRSIKWEQVKNEPGTFTIRLSKSYRAVVERRLCYFKRWILTTMGLTAKSSSNFTQSPLRDR